MGYVSYTSPSVAQQQRDESIFDFLIVVSPFLKKMVGLRRNGHAKRNKMSYFLGLGSKCGSS